MLAIKYVSAKFSSKQRATLTAFCIRVLQCVCVWPQPPASHFARLGKLPKPEDATALSLQNFKVTI